MPAKPRRRQDQGGSHAKPAKHALGSGIAVEYIEPSVRVQDDFFTHLNGKWLKTTEIPADKASWGTFAKLDDDLRPQLRAIIEDAAKSPNQKAGSDAQRIGDFYASFMDEQKLETLGLTPLNAELARIAAIKDKAELPAMMAHLGQLGVRVPYDFGIHQDAKDSTKYVADIAQGGLGLPDRDYYLKADDAKLADALAKYQVHVEKMLALAGSKTAAADAKAIVAFETELARGAVDQGGKPRSGEDLQQGRAGEDGRSGARLRLEVLPRQRRHQRQGQLRRGQPAELPEGLRRTVEQDLARHLEAVPAVPPDQRVRELPVEAVRRRAFRVLRHHPVGRDGNAAALEARA